MSRYSQKAIGIVGMLDYYRESGRLEKLDADVRDAIYEELDALTAMGEEASRQASGQKS